MNNLTKKCNRCNQILPIEEFSKSSICKDGHVGICRKCRRESNGLTTPNTIICPICKKELPYYYFDITKGNDTGRKGLCKECLQKGHSGTSSYRGEIDQDYRKKKCETRNKSRLNNIEKSMGYKAQGRANEKNIEFNIDVEDIIIPELCPILEIPIIIGNTHSNYESSPSLDRIDNNKGYIKGNVGVISSKANTMKNSATGEELTLFCKNILRYSPTNIEKEDIESKDKEP